MGNNALFPEVTLEQRQQTFFVLREDTVICLSPGSTCVLFESPTGRLKTSRVLFISNSNDTFGRMCFLSTIQISRTETDRTSVPELQGSKPGRGTGFNYLDLSWFYSVF